MRTGLDNFRPKPDQVTNRADKNQMKRKVLRVIDGETVFPPPIWMMRQAGRYLPEYRETRKKAGSFLDLCYSPDLAVEVTLQPIRRFGFDAAILFSDILVIPHALGRDLRFEEGKGPLMTPIDADEIFWLETEGVAKRLEPVYETVRLLREQLPDETTLLGFCGAPWTVATYMIAGHGTPDQAPARLFAYRFPEAFEKLLNDLADVSAEYLIEKLPVLQWLPHYNWRWALNDAIAGITVGVMFIPQGLAYAKIANIPVEHGLYSCWIPSALYFFLGTSKGS